MVVLLIYPCFLFGGFLVIGYDVLYVGNFLGATFSRVFVCDVIDNGVVPVFLSVVFSGDILFLVVVLSGEFLVVGNFLSRVVLVILGVLFNDVFVGNHDVSCVLVGGFLIVVGFRREITVSKLPSYDLKW